MFARRRTLALLVLPFAAGLVGFGVFAQQTIPAGTYPSALLAGLEWRDVGPMRGGRTFAVAGHGVGRRWLVEDRELRPDMVPDCG
jgi:hypothetical protein